MSDKYRDKRWRREHRQRQPAAAARVVYRPRTEAEGQRRAARAKQLMGTPFVALPGIEDHRTILFTAKVNGTPIPAEAVEMVFNDALLCDAVSAWGADGPLYSETLTGDELQREVYEYAQRAYAGIELPEQLRKPGQALKNEPAL